MQLCGRTCLYLTFGLTNLRALPCVDAIATITVELPRGDAGLNLKGTCNFTNTEIMKLKASEVHALFGLNLFEVLEWSELHFAFVTALC